MVETRSNHTDHLRSQTTHKEQQACNFRQLKVAPGCGNPLRTCGSSPQHQL